MNKGHCRKLAQQGFEELTNTMKEQIVSTLTKHQRVDIWDLVGMEDFPTHEDVLKHDLQPGDPRWTTTEIVSPDRILFLNGAMQSDYESNHEYHEAMAFERRGRTVVLEKLGAHSRGVEWELIL